MDRTDIIVSGKAVTGALPQIVRQYKAVTVASGTAQGYLTFNFTETLPASFSAKSILVTAVLDNNSGWNDYVTVELSQRSDIHNVYAFYRCFLNSESDLKGFMCTVIY